MSFPLVGRVSGTGRFRTAAILSSLADNSPKALLNSAQADLHRLCSASPISRSACPKPYHQVSGRVCRDLCKAVGRTPLLLSAHQQVQFLIYPTHKVQSLAPDNFIAGWCT